MCVSLGHLKIPQNIPWFIIMFLVTWPVGQDCPNRARKPWRTIWPKGCRPLAGHDRLPQWWLDASWSTDQREIEGNRHKSRSVSNDHQWSNGCFSRRSRGLSARWLQRSRACSNAQRSGFHARFLNAMAIKKRATGPLWIWPDVGAFPIDKPRWHCWWLYNLYIQLYIYYIPRIFGAAIPYYFCGKCRKCHSFWTNFWLSKCRAGLATVVAVCLLAWGICHNAFVSWPWKGSGQVEPLWFVQRPYCGWCS